jgi:hypothetical protein
VDGEANTLQCDAPPLPALAAVAVTVSLDGQYYTNTNQSGVLFMPLDELAARTVLPSSGPAHGGTSVQVRANGLRGASELRCRFGNTSVVAQWDASAYGSLEGAVAAGALACAVPPLALDLDVSLLASLDASLNTTGVVVDGASAPRVWPGLPLAVSVEVSANGAEYSHAAPSARVLFTYHQPPPNNGLTAIEPPTGPLNGHTHVEVSGLSMAGASMPTCRFGGTVVDGTVRAGSGAAGDAITCVAPPHGLTGAVALSLSLNGQQWMTTRSVFTYAPPPSLSSLLPDIAPNVGGLVLELSGTDLDGGTGYRCRFGAAQAATAPTEAAPPPTVAATYDAASGSILCVSPSGLLGYVPVRVSLNAQQFTPSGPLLTVYDPDALDSLDSLLQGEADTVANVLA